MEMTRVTATEFQKSFGEMSDKALQEPVAITKQGRDHLVLMSAAEYARLLRRGRKVHRSGELPDDLFEALKNSKMDPKYDYLNDELKDWTP